MKSFDTFRFLYFIFLFFWGTSLYPFFAKVTVRSQETNWGNPREKFQKMRESSKPIIGGIVDASRHFLNYPIYDIPKEIQILTVAFAGRYSPCDVVHCGHMYKWYNYRNSEDKNVYINDIIKLKKERPELIVLFELNDKILYEKNIEDAFSIIDDLIAFLNEFHFDGINYRISYIRLNGAPKDTKKMILFYEKFLAEMKAKMNKNHLFVLTLNHNGAISSTNTNSEYYTDDMTPYNKNFLTGSKCHQDLRDISKLKLSGIAIPIIKKLKSDIDMIVITEEPYTLPEKMKHLITDFYHSYLIYADQYNFATHVSFNFVSKTYATMDIDENAMKQLSGMVKKENGVFSRGDGFTFLNIGFSTDKAKEQAVLRKAKEILF